MYRTARRASGGAALLLAATLVLAACGPQSQGGDDSTEESTSEGESESGDLMIVPSVQIDIDGAEVPAAEAGEPVDPAGDGSAECAEGTAIAVAGAFTGPNAALGLNIQYGAQLAVDAFNEANAGCQVELKPFDTEGDPQKATQVAPQIVSDDAVIGLLGPAFSGETAATGDVFNQAGLLSLTASATNPDLTGNGWTNFFRGLANDAVQGPSVAKYMTETLGYTSVCVVADNSDYGIGLAEQITSGLGDAANADCAPEVKTGDKDFSAAVQIISGSEADAVFYSGYYAEAAPFVQGLRDGGVDLPFVSADGVNDPQFVSQAGSSSQGAILSCPCGPAPEDFAATYEDANGQAPGVYSTEGYDLATIMLTGIASGVSDRAGLIDYVKDYSGEGLARQYEWDDTGELTSALIWIYEVE
ncbi:branched-chain amino acid ABC transporter substrate-binding protein [Cellulosimicrobium arenosum]|uniref:Branched-chain amino acid ABC transporter substrate-binding protein n=1 Tax=Cellulosimicrobium arenosum TaxID=2708133 RepID=A0A927IZI0_9MICO|nr:branched-chain amino acid ABC transporter substrate-binding protein [Cellulosimicrobium arenosum]MBD8078565.1 branched-chain amino acid ABC transporter substrate-binding protein [Cellulosimicrobium arenosum]